MMDILGYIFGYIFGCMLIFVLRSFVNFVVGGGVYFLFSEY